MHRIDGAGHIGNQFTEGDPLTGTPATVITDDFLNDLMENICRFLEAAGVTLVKNNYDQLKAAAVKKNGDTMTGDLVLDDATMGGTRRVRVQARTAGGGLVQGQIIASGAALAYVLEALTNHPIQFYINGSYKMNLSEAGTLTVLLGDIETKGASTRNILVESTGDNPQAKLIAKGKTDGGVVVEGRFVASETGNVGFGSITNHDSWIQTNGLIRMRIAADGKLTTFPLAYESANQSIVNGTLITLPHGLTAVPPRHVWAMLKCVTAELGYAINDEVPVATLHDGTNNCGVGLIVRGSNIIVNIGAQGPKIYSGTTPGTLVAITNANWRIVVRAIP